jgi:hypothetical protein
VWRGRRAREVVDLVDLEEDGLDDVMPDQLKVGVPNPAAKEALLFLSL